MPDTVTPDITGNGKPRNVARADTAKNATAATFPCNATTSFPYQRLPRSPTFNGSTIATTCACCAPAPAHATKEKHSAVGDTTLTVNV